MSAILIQYGAPTFFHVNEEYAAEIDNILFLKKLFRNNMDLRVRKYQDGFEHHAVRKLDH